MPGPVAVLDGDRSSLKLIAFQDYYNGYRKHVALKGKPPVETPGCRVADLKSYGWQSHVAGFTKHQSRREQEFAMHRSAWPLLRPVKEIARSVFRCNAKKANLALKGKVFQMILHFSE